MRHVTVAKALQGNSVKVAVVVSLFNENITKKLLEGAIGRLLMAGFNEDDILVVEVPGAVEIPLTCQRILQDKKYHGVIALGAVVRGETTHYDYVCQQVSYGCQKVSLASNVPVIFGVLTTEDEEQAYDRLGGRHGHKGEYAADCLVAMLNVLKLL
ncbi:MAG: 6,7-dimethyl-8-ribityllumazine synthase [Legionellales bacterium RIFCSPHIGHO2_12_FULL_35_11]|nr:MAG: 6,7-dimethyl-8-ribityllumazine synthase [Legionellales bacterium RIFCSPHIGHO2_12_FULL_35_11]